MKPKTSLPYRTTGREIRYTVHLVSEVHLSVSTASNKKRRKTFHSCLVFCSAKLCRVFWFYGSGSIGPNLDFPGHYADF